MKKKLMAIISIAAIAVMVFGILSSGAWFTTSKATTPSTITAATLNLDDSGIAQAANFVVTNMAPGDQPKELVITIKNNGTIPLAWYGNWNFTGSNLLREAIYVDFAKMEFLSPSGANWQPVEGTCPAGNTPGSTTEGADTFIKDGQGYGCYAAATDAQLRTGPGSSVNKFGVISLQAFDDNSLMSGGKTNPAFPYEHMGALKPQYSYRLTMHFGFAESAGNAYQGAGPLSIQFNVMGTQINVNALNALYAGLGADFVWLNNQPLKQTMP